jgi:hypothetical protein
MITPVVFGRVCDILRRHYGNDRDLGLSLPDIAQITRAPDAICAAAVASLINADVLKWSYDCRTVLRADAAEEGEKRRTA